jgi:hypothetical protein
MPDVKLIFLMRDPISRAWSHAKHNLRYREANFAAADAEFGAITADQWRENFAHDWPLVSGDYLGQLRRWLAVFPREQMYVGFYESIARRPQTLLRELFTFLGVDADVDLSAFPVLEKILPGPSKPLPAGLDAFLQQLLGQRTRDLVSYLGERFHLQVPPEWNASCALPQTPPTGEGEIPVSRFGPADVFRREFDDRYLSHLLGLEEAFPSGAHLAVASYQGYGIVLYRGRWYAFDPTLGAIYLPEMCASEVQRYHDQRTCFSALSLSALAEQVDEHLARQLQHRLEAIDSLGADLQRARAQIARLEQSLRDCVNDPYRAGADGRGALASVVLRIVGEAIPLYRWHVWAVKVLRRVWGCLRTPITTARRAGEGGDGALAADSG